MFEDVPSSVNVMQSLSPVIQSPFEISSLEHQPAFFCNDKSKREKKKKVGDFVGED